MADRSSTSSPPAGSDWIKPKDEDRLLKHRLEKLNVPQLKFLCKKYGVAVSGKKDDLLDRTFAMAPSHDEIKGAQRTPLRSNGEVDEAALRQKQKGLGESAAIIEDPSKAVVPFVGAHSPLAAGPPSPLAAAALQLASAAAQLGHHRRRVTALAAGPGHHRSCAAGPPSPLAAGPPSPLAAGPASPLAHGPPSPLAAGPPSPLAAGSPSPFSLWQPLQQRLNDLLTVAAVPQRPPESARVMDAPTAQRNQKHAPWQDVPGGVAAPTTPRGTPQVMGPPSPLAAGPPSPLPASCAPTEPDRDLDPLTPTGVPRHRLSPMTAQTPELVSFPKGSGDSTIGGEQSLHRSATYESPLPRGWTPPSSPSPATMLSPGFQAERARLERDLAAYLGMEQLSDNIPVATTPSSTGTPLSTARSLESQLWSDTLPEMEPLPERDTLPRGTLPEMEPLPTNIAGLLNANLAGTLGEDSGGAETPRSKRQRLCDDVFLEPLEEESPEDLNSESSAEPNSEHTEEPTGDTEEHTMEHTEEPTGDTEEQYAPRITEDTMEPTEEQYCSDTEDHTEDTEEHTDRRPESLELEVQPAWDAMSESFIPLGDQRRFPGFPQWQSGPGERPNLRHSTSDTGIVELAGEGHREGGEGFLSAPDFGLMSESPPRPAWPESPCTFSGFPTW